VGAMTAEEVNEAVDASWEASEGDATDQARTA
jgi:hypothetical protein